MSKKSDDRKNVVIVGGGGYGAGLARNLSDKLDPSKYNLILINPRPYYIHLVAAVRFTVTSEGKLEDRAFIPYDKLFVNGNGTFVQGQVTAIDHQGHDKGGELSLRDGTTLHYDALVLATGATWTGPLHFPDGSDDVVRASVEAWRRKYSAANEVVFVGGGAVGIETAGEVRDAFPDKKITIIHASEQLLNETYPARFRSYVTKKVLDRDINLILGDKLDSIPAEGTVGITTHNGKHLPNADLVIPTFGGRPNTAVIASLGDVLNSHGFVKVSPTLEVRSRPGVFALGDSIDWPEQKQLGKAPGQIATVSTNLLSFLSGQKPAKLYKSPPEIIVIPVGKNGGAAYAGILWGLILGNWVVRTLKGKDLFVGMYRKKFGLAA